VTERDFVHRGFGGEATPEAIASSVVLLRTREAAAALAATWTAARRVADHYGWQLWTGDADGVRLTAGSTGTGSASAAIAVEELAILGARTFLGVGAVPGTHERPGQIVVAEGAMRFDAASHGYVRAGYPAVPDHEVTLAAFEAARAQGVGVRGAILADVDAPPDVRLGTPPRPSGRAAAIDTAIRETGAVRVTGSPAVLFVQGTVHGLRTGFLAAAADDASQSVAAAVAVSALRRLG
jgi:uridine phosphorylase